LPEPRFQKARTHTRKHTPKEPHSVGVPSGLPSPAQLPAASQYKWCELQGSLGKPHPPHAWGKAVHKQLWRMASAFGGWPVFVQEQKNKPTASGSTTPPPWPPCETCSNAVPRERVGVGAPARLPKRSGAQSQARATPPGEAAADKFAQSWGIFKLQVIRGCLPAWGWVGLVFPGWGHRGGGKLCKRFGVHPIGVQPRVDLEPVRANGLLTCGWLGFRASPPPQVRTALPRKK
jgi:hypothetical protein